MTTKISDRDPVEALAESFVERLRRGEHPSVTEYTEKYPELADGIRDLFPTLAMVERLGPTPAKEADERAGQLAGERAELRRLGEYRIIREIGHGGMGVVYEAEQESLGRHVALKVLPARAAADPTHLKRFHREARAAARLHHTNIVPVFDVGENDGVHYYAMQFIQGQGLDEVFVELRRLRGFEKPQAAEVGTETFHERAAHSELANTIVRGLVSGHFSRAESCTTDSDSDAGVLASARSDRTGCRSEQPEGCTPTLASPRAPGSSDTVNLAMRERSDATCRSGSTGTNSSAILRGQLADASETHAHYFQSVARIALQVAEALEYAHGQGLLHRDIKPSNLILDTGGVVWVTDFGLAKNEGENLTHTGDVVGTLRYMAPERFRGRADARSDVYSLGLTLYEFLTLRAVFEESDRARLVQHVLHDDPPRPRKTDRHIPRDLETIVCKAIDKDPEHRYRTAAELADDLRLFLADKPIQARRSSIIERVWRWSRRNPAVAGLAASVLALLVFASVGATLFAFNMREHARALGIENARVLRAEGVAIRRLFDSYVNEARAERFSRRPGQRFDGLAAIRNAAELLPALELPRDEESQKRLALRNQAIASMALLDLKQRANWPGDSRRTGWAFDAAVERYARGDMDGNVSIRRLSDDQEVIRLPGFGVPVWSIRFSGDNRYVAARYEHNSPATFVVWDLSRGAGVQPPSTTGEDQPATDQRQAGILPHVLNDADVILKVDEVARADALDFSPDNQLIAVARYDSSISIFNLSVGREHTRFSPGFPPTRLRFDPSGGKLAIASVDGRTANGRKVHEVQVRHLATSKVDSIGHPDGVHGIAWHSDGKRLATACANRRAYIWDTETRRRLSVLEGHEQYVNGVAFDPSGELLASATHGVTRLWDVSTGQQLLAAEGQCGEFSSDGCRLGFVIGWEVGVWDLAAGREWRTLAAELNLRSLDVSQDGSLLAAAASHESGVTIWDIRTGTRMRSLGIGPTLSAIFHPNGQELITSGAAGLLRWPLARDNGESAGELRIGPPQKLAEVSTNKGRAALDQIGRRIVIDESRDSAVVIDLGQPTTRIRLQPHPQLHYVAISPDGKWAATGTWQGTGVNVWDAESGHLEADLMPDRVSATTAFSPDGKLLVVGTGIEYAFFEVPTWRLKYRVARDHGGNHGGHVAFTRDGRLAAIAQSRPLIDLIDPDTGRRLATLEPPNPTAVGSLVFTPDGSHLVAESNNTIQLWDLRRIREQLATMGLDWDGPS